MARISSKASDSGKKTIFSSIDPLVFESFFEKSMTLFWIKDTRNNIIKISTGAARLYGKKAEEIEGRPMDAFLSKSISDKRQEEDKKIIRTKKPLMNYQLTFPVEGTGKKIHIRLNKVPLTNSEGKVTHIITYGDDITEQIEAEESLRKSEARSAALLDAIPDMLFVTDQNGVFSFVRADENLLYIKHESIIGKNISELLPPEIAAQCLGHIREAFRTGKLQTFEYALPVNRELKYFEARIIAEEENIISLIRDITEKKKLENDAVSAEVKFREFRNEIVHTLSDALVSSLPLHDFFAIVQSSLEKHISTDQLCIMLYDETGKTHTCAYCSRALDDASKKPAGVSGILDHVMKSMQPSLLKRAEFEALISKLRLKHKGAIPEYWIGVPMKTGKEYLGILTLSNFSADKKLDHNALEIITLVSNLVAVAISKKSTEEKLAQQLDFLNSLMENVPEAIYVKDTGSRFVRVSKTFANRLDYSDPEELTGKTDFDLYNNAHAKEAFADEKKIMSTGVPLVSKEELEIWPTGEKRWVNSSKMPWHNADGEIMGTFGISFDITKRKLAEEELKRNQVMLETVLNSIPQSVFWKDKAGIYLGCNTVFSALTGFSNPSQLIGKNDFDLFRPKVLAQHYRDDDLEVLQSGTGKYHIIEPFYLKNNTKLWIDTNKVPLKDESGQIYGVLGIFQDITARKNAEESLILSEARLKEAQRIGKIGSYEFNLQTQELYWSDESYRIFGAEPGMSNPLEIVLSRIVPESKARFEGFIKQIFSGKALSVEDMEMRIVDAENNRRFLQLRGNSITDQDGNPLRFSGTFQDITDRKQAEMAVQESRRNLAEANKMLRLIIDTIPIRVFWKSKESVFMGCNARFVQDAGCETPDQLIGKTDYDMPWKDQAEAYCRDDQEVMAKEAPKMNFEEMQTNPEGKQIWLRTSKVPLRNLDNEIIGILGTYDDITGAKEKEVELKSKNEELERFTYTVSHDLKSPLVTIRGFVGLLEEDIEAGDLENVKTNIERIKSAAEKMSSLLNNLLELSRVGRFTNPFVKVSMSKIVKETLDNLTGILQLRQVKIVMPPSMPEVYADTQRMAEVWQNLIENAVKFMGSQPKPLIEIGFVAREKELEFFIHDNGIGIDIKYYDTIFGLFNKLDNKTEGTGFGLALVKRIIEVHGGNISVTSQGQGHGTTFNFTLPVIKRK